MLNEFDIYENEYLSKKTIGYYNRYYTGFRQQDNPDFLNTLKNTFNSEIDANLEFARKTVLQILVADILDIVRNHMSNYTIVCIPRAKILNTYTDSQLLFLKAIRDTIAIIKYEYEPTWKIFVIDGTDCITRIKNTRTTHLPETTGRVTRDGRDSENVGDNPYPGITKATCLIDKNRIKGQNIILIDDIYTKNVNIDEDCIQALYDNGAKTVIFYAIGYTRRNL